MEPADATRHQPVARWEIAVVVLCTLVGAALRFWNLAELPPGLFYDEAINGLDALTILREPGWPVFFSTENHMREPLWMYLEALGVLIGGTNGTALRAVGAATGTLTIPAVWWMTRTLFGPRAALFAILFFTLMRWHLQFSRLAFRTILAPLFCCLIVTFVARTIRGMRLRDAIIAGALMALSLYTYLAMRLFILGVGIWGIWWMIANRHEWPARQIWRNVIAAAAAFILVFSPAAIDYIHHPEHFTGRQDEVSLVGQGAEGWLTIARQARDVALMPTLRGDHVAKHNIPGPPRFSQPVLWGSNGPDSHGWWRDIDPAEAPDPHGTGLAAFDIITGLLLYLGIGILLVRASRRRAWPDRLFLFWLLFGAAASVFSFGAPNMLRLQLLTPVCALGLAIAADAIFQRLLVRSFPLAAGTIALWLCWFWAGETYRYFVVYPKHPAVYFEFNTNFTDITDWISAHDDRPEAIILPGYIRHAPTVVFETDSIPEVLAAEEIKKLPSRAWVLLPHAPFPPANVTIPDNYSVAEVARFEFPTGDAWATMVEITAE